MISLATALLLSQYVNNGQGSTRIGGSDQIGNAHTALVTPGGNVSVQQYSPASYTNKVTKTSGLGVYSTTVGDFNNDGNVDIITANFGVSNVTLYLGLADGTLSGGTAIPTIAGPRFAVTGDFNNDGCLDFAVSNRSTTIGIYLGNCLGGFSAGTKLTAPGSVQALGAAQLTGSGNWSIVAGQMSGTGTYVFIGAGNGTFAAPVSYVGPNNCRQLVLVDLNSDGFTDMVCAGQGDNTVGILFGAAAGTFGTLQSTALTGHVPGSIAVADFNGDGILDVVVGDVSSTTPSGAEVFLGGYVNSGNYYQLVTSTAYPVTTNAQTYVAQGIMTGDFNGDGFQDIAVNVYAGTGNPYCGIFILAGNGTGQFFNTGLIPLSVPGQTVNTIYPTAFDINKDGHPDLIAPNFYGSATSPSLFVLYSSAIVQVTPALGSNFLMTGNVTQTHSGAFSCNVNGVSATTQCQAAPFYYQQLNVQSVTLSNSTAASSLSIISGTGTNCATGSATVAGVYYEPVNGTSSLSFVPPLRLNVGQALCCATAGSTPFSCTVQGFAQ